MTSFTIEFWMKTETSAQGTRAIMLSLSPESQRSQQVFQIGKEGFHMVYCYPQMQVDQLQLGSKVRFRDYLDSNRGWQHFSCAFDFD